MSDIYRYLLTVRIAPYFSTIKPQFLELKPGYTEVAIKKRRKVTNHINTVHAIAMCNMAELAGGIMTDVSVPTKCRWIPVGMTVEVKDTAGNLFFRAEITMNVRFA
ncbi:DUF4442 domain-containing protein [uncultured Photobacterium sp.]|uniref:DUF4442 domain-containing protein n=1 Tax=uncultured Photobacterium sp. TaxID=173973 RepID=UPI0026151432|nr:DUF4442 domain-containing protein [uncultured Photobacterium sp.]